MNPAPAFKIGTSVLVRNRFNGVWAPDFRILAVEANGCRIRRDRDGAVLPKVFAWEDLRATADTALDLTARWAG
jgi:hypothetical protein